MIKKYGLCFETPASDWLEAIPLGNGHLGVMVDGNLNQGSLHLNDDTLWSGYERRYINEKFRESLKVVRTKMELGELKAAQDIIETEMLGPFTQVFLPFGNIDYSYSGWEEPEEYVRSLDFATGIATAEGRKGDSFFTTESFCSFPQDLFIHRTFCDTPFSMSISFSSQLIHRCSFSQNGIVIEGVAPSNIVIGDVYNFSDHGNTVSYEEKEKSIHFAGIANIVTNGTVCECGDSLRVEDATEITIYYTSGTSFVHHDPLAHCVDTINSSMKIPYSQLLEVHVSDMSTLYHEVEIDFGGEKKDTPEIVSLAKRGDFDGFTLGTLFQYGRYLLIASSRRGSQPANLQGVWNKHLIPPWWSNYTLNINLQMNYWHAHRTGLGDCLEPLHTFITRLCKRGKETAQEWYHMRGFVLHHQSDLWAHTTPVGFGSRREKDSASWGMWNMSGVWLCLDLFKHHQFTGDKSFLVKVLHPLYKECFAFLKDWLMFGENNIYTAPSTSPEHMYHWDNNLIAITQLSAMDRGLLFQFFSSLKEISYLTKDLSIESEVDSYLEKLPEYTIEDGCIAEWGKESRGVDNGHRHFSHLIEAYPYGSLLSDTYRLIAETSFQKRMINGGGSTGWSAAWSVALAARFGDSLQVEYGLRVLLEHNIHPNLFGGHPPSYFQIDANFGIVAGMCELLVQDYDGIIRLLPAIPDCLSSGEVKNFRVRGGHKVSFTWDQKKLKTLVIEGGFDPVIRLSIGPIVIEDEKGSSVSVVMDTPEVAVFPVSIGMYYTIYIKECAYA